jgi:cell wall-associated NlpC family hydrolase
MRRQISSLWQRLGIACVLSACLAIQMVAAQSTAPASPQGAPSSAPIVKHHADTSTGAAFQPSTSATDPITLPPTQQDAMGDLIVHALSLIGVRYKYGGNTVEGFDCSGFVRHLFQSAFQFNLPRSAKEISTMGNEVSLDQLVPGDLVFYNTLRRQFSHVGVYIGEGRFVHAPSKGKSVEIVQMKDSYWKKRFNGARRLVSVVSEFGPAASLQKITRTEAEESDVP